MAKLERTIYEDFGTLLYRIETGIMQSSISASIEDKSDFIDGDARCSVRVFERYSWMGGNRLSLNVTLFQNGRGPVHLTAVTAGGSSALFYKINIYGEEAFLKKLEEILNA